MMKRENKGIIEEETGDLEDMNAFSSLLTEYNPKALFSTLQYALFFSLPLDKVKLLKTNPAMGTTEVKTKLLCLYVQI
jgi:hypothetical protein